MKPGGFGLLALKARSVDVSRNPKEIFREIRAKLERELVIVDYRELDPFEMDHAMFVVKKKDESAAKKDDRKDERPFKR